MHKQFYFLSPVEVVKVTSQNLEEVAEWCGGSVQETESRRVPGRMDKYVLVPTPKDTNISWAFPGMFITKRLVVTVKDELLAAQKVLQKTRELAIEAGVDPAELYFIQAVPTENLQGLFEVPEPA